MPYSFSLPPGMVSVLSNRIHEPAFLGMSNIVQTAALHTGDDGQRLIVAIF